MSRSERRTQIYISGFSRGTNNDDLRDAFKKFGEVRDVSIKRGYAFIEYDDRDQAEDAVQSMHNKDLDGKRLTVEMAGKEKRRTRGPQQEDECWGCGKTGHWRNDCPRYRRGGGGGRGRSRSRSSSSSSSSSSASSRSRSRDRRRRRNRSPSSSSSSNDRRRRRTSRKDKKKKKDRRRSASSSSSRSSRSGSK